jgi:hypothetical protein
MVALEITAIAKEMASATLKEREQMVATRPVVINFLARF